MGREIEHPERTIKTDAILQKLYMVDQKSGHIIITKYNQKVSAADRKQAAEGHNKWFHNRRSSLASDHTGKMTASVVAAISIQTDSHVTTDSHVGNQGSWAFTVN